MSSLFKLKRIDPAIEDNTKITLARYAHIVPHSVFEQHQFKAQIKLYSPTCDFISTPMMLLAWTITPNKEIIRKQTDISTVPWIEAMNFKQTNSIYWPDIQQSDIKEFKYDVLFVVKYISTAPSNEIYLQIE